MNLKRGLTILEILVVTGIILVLFSIAAPAIVRVRASARESTSKSNLRQIYVGLALYREDSGIKAEYGTAVEMGLPEALMSTNLYKQVVPDDYLWRSPCCCHKDAPTGHPEYKSYFTDYAEIFSTEGTWTRYVKEWEAASILVMDFHCNDSSLNLYAPRGDSAKGLGVRLNGKVEARVRRVGIGSYDYFWNH